MVARNTMPKAMYPRFAQPNTAFGVKYSAKRATGAINGKTKCLVILFFNFDDCPVLLMLNMLLKFAKGVEN